MSDLHYIDKGAGSPVVLLHAFPVDLRIWQHQIDALSDQYRILAIDLPGFGKSPAAKNFTIDSVAEQVRALLKKINALPCALAGLSLGGYIALAFYQQCPTDVSALMLVDTRACGDTADSKKNRTKLIEQIDQCGPQVVVDAMMPKVLADHTVAAEPHVVELVRNMMLECPAETMKQALAAMRDRPDRTGLLASIAEPVLILAGECDAITPPIEAQRMRSAMPHAQLTIIPDASHYSPMENPNAVNQSLRSFLAGLGR